MLIPIGTNVEHRNYPKVTYWIIGLNILIFALQWATARAGGLESQNAIVHYLATLEAEGTLSRSNFHFLSLFSYQFIHAGWFHIIFNMLFLLPFGKVVEDRMGHLGFLAFYLGAGAIGGYVHTLLHTNGVVGASGSVCAVVAAFVVLAPKTKTHVLLVFFIIGIYSLPSMLLVAFFVAIDVFSQITSLLGIHSGNTAWAVHLCGYASGFLIAYIGLKTNWIRSTEFDLTQLVKQWSRRRSYKNAFEQPSVRKPVSQKQDDPEYLLRVSIADEAANGNIKQATVKYLQAVEDKPSFKSDAGTLHLIGASLMQSNELAKGAQVFERYLVQHKQAKDKGEVALLLAAKYIRELENKNRGAELLKDYADNFSSEHTPLVDKLTAEVQS
ncbi:MAG: rhomboid family intramembrane serine protease [Phycisphaerae bacterium]|jgi:membrane associated rhomboid family serine protease|nr:rhomboid family intramembrane serine protease [Phycisphaerae bacterium]